MMRCRKKYSHTLSLLCLATLLTTGLPALLHAETINWRASGGMTIKSVHYLKTESQTQEISPQQNSPTPMETVTTPTFPVPPLAGFSPLIAITTSNKQNGNVDTYEHVLESSYSGSPLNSPVEDNFIIGVFDSGAEVDLIAGSSAQTLGRTGSKLTGDTFPLGGVGGTILADISEPGGIFASGLGAIGSNGRLDPNYLIGHSNTSAVVSPEISCEETGESITGVIGTPFLSFYTTVIRNDYIHRVNVGSHYIASPDVEILQQDDPTIPEYSHKISITLSGLATTANYYPGEVLGIPTGLAMPTLLSAVPGSLPTGGKYIATI